jgi:uncharacterized protein (DUF1778 family)
VQARIPAKAVRLIDRAAKLVNLSRSAFIARAAAKDAAAILLQQRAAS